MSYKYSFKYIITGNPGVGKSSLLLKFVEEKFYPLYDVTIGVELGNKIIKIDDMDIKINIYDTAGQQQFQNITRQYFKNTSVAMVVYDTTDMKSFEDAKNWLQVVRKQNNDDVTIVLIGNKSDKVSKRQVKQEDARCFSIEQGIYFYETSAKNNSNINEIFYDTATNVLEKVKKNKIVSGVKLGNDKGIINLECEFNRENLICCAIM